MRTKRDRVKCPVCLKVLGARTDGSGPVAHRCPHKRQCVKPNWAGHSGMRLAKEPCPECAAARAPFPGGVA